MGRRVARARLVVLSTVILPLAALAACQGSDAPPKPQPQVSPDNITRYVAMGDSFVSGPAITPQQQDSGACLRSQRNYPQLLAKELAIPEVVDVSCAGAATVHLMNDIPLPGKPGGTVEAQTEALNSKTGLVTVGIGYNNDAIFPKLLASCLPSGQGSAKAGACQEFADEAVHGLLKKVRADVVDALQATRKDAPNATVVLVGYLPLLPEPKACPAGVFKGDNQRSTYDVEVAVDDMLRAAADAAGTEFVSMRDAGRGHGMCAGDDAWVNGLKVAAGDGVIVHPRVAGMQAVADAVAEKLRTSGR